jgi:hypothetical protein
MLLAEADRCKERGELGAFLRRKRIYSSMLSSWRKQLGAADNAVLAPQTQAGGADHRRPKKLCVALGLPTADETSGDE